METRYDLFGLNCYWQSFVPEPATQAYDNVPFYQLFDWVMFHVRRQVTEIVSSLHFGRSPVQEHQGLYRSISCAGVRFRDS